MTQLLNCNGGVYVNGEAYPPQIYRQVETALMYDIRASSREVAKQYHVGKSFVCNVRNKILQGEEAAPKLRGGITLQNLVNKNTEKNSKGYIAPTTFFLSQLYVEHSTTH